MIDINPQLQSKIFDSLLLHMKAERAGRNIPARRRCEAKPAAVSRGRPVAPEKTGGKTKAARKSRSRTLRPLQPGGGFAPDGIGTRPRDALVSWAAPRRTKAGIHR